MHPEAWQTVQSQSGNVFLVFYLLFCAHVRTLSFVLSASGALRVEWIFQMFLQHGIFLFCVHICSSSYRGGRHRVLNPGYGQSTISTNLTICYLLVLQYTPLPCEWWDLHSWLADADRRAIFIPAYPPPCSYLLWFNIYSKAVKRAQHGGPQHC